MARKVGNEDIRRPNVALRVVFVVVVVAALAGGIAFIGLRGAGRLDMPMASTTAQKGGEPWFEDVALSFGIDFTYQSGHDGKTYYMPEIMGGGACLFDFDDDGDLDVYLVQGGRVVGPKVAAIANRLYRNDGGRFVDVTAMAGVGDAGYGMGCATGDFNNDGRVDLYVTNVGPNVLYRNNGDATFDDVTATAGVGHDGFSASAAYVDFDHDGDLDLFVTNYVAWSVITELQCSTPSGGADYCKPTHYNAPQANALYRNNGDGTFTDISVTSGITSNYGNSLGVVCTDFDRDGWIDIAVANDETPNTLWMNQKNGTFREEAVTRGFAYNAQGLIEAGMGLEAVDFDFDSDVDFFCTHIDGELNTLYVNEGGYCEDRTARYGLASARPFTGFGTAIADFNNDSYFDVYVANGRVVIGHGEYYRNNRYAEPNQLWRGKADVTFEEVMPRGGTATLLNDSSRGAAFGDLDNDGRLDVVVVNRDARAYLLRNVTKGSNWIGFNVLNAIGSPAIGAQIVVEYGGKMRLRDVRTAYSYCAGNDPRVHFGLGAAEKVTGVEVTWPDRTVQKFGDFAAGAYHELRRK